MGVDAYAHLCFGVPLDYGEMEAPWLELDDEEESKYDYDFQTWLLEQNGMEAGTPYEEEREFLDALTVELVVHGGGDVEGERFIMAIRSTVTWATWDREERVLIPDIMSEQVAELLDFCDKYGLKYSKQPGWYLSAFLSC